jgi:hypothetical protein
LSYAQATLVQRVRWYLGDTPWETTGSASSSSSVVAVSDGTDWQEGDIGEFNNNGENFWVNSISSNNLTAVRGYYGSTAATQASGRVLKAPRYRYSEITNAASAVIKMLPYPRVYKVTADTITPAPTTTVWYDLAADALGIVRASQLFGSTSNEIAFYGQANGKSGPRILYKNGLPASLATSTVGVRFPDGFAHVSNTVSIDYAARVTDTIVTTNYSDFSDGEALTEAIIFGTVAMLETELELRKPRKPTAETSVARGASMFEDRFRRALHNAEKDIRQKNPLMHTWQGPM